MLTKRKWLAASIAAALGAVGATAVYTQGGLPGIAGVGSTGTPSAGSAGAAAASGGSTLETRPETYIVVMDEAPLATYEGTIAGLPAPQRLQTARGDRIDVHGMPAKQYVSYLRRVQSLRAADLGRTVGRPLHVRHAMQHALNAVVTELTPAEAHRLARVKGVAMVEPYREYPLASDVGPRLIGADPIWAGTVPGEPGRFQGEGLVVGIIDTGINFGSPSFSAVDPVDGYRHVNELGAGNYLGTCAPGGVDEGRCNDKLIGGYDFVCGIATGPTSTICSQTGLYREEPGFGDTNSHGSHVASTAAGNRRNVVFRGASLRIAGVAPRANIVAYDTCYTNLATGGGSCPNVATVAAVNQAVADGVVDVLNYSIGGGTSPWGDAISQAFLNAVDAGIYVAAAAGNSGPGPDTTGHHQPWVGTTAASQHGRGDFINLMSVTGPGNVPAALRNMPINEGSGAVANPGAWAAGTPLKVSPGIDTAGDGCAAFAAGTFTGSIALVRRGTCSFTVKVNNAAAAGAIAVVVANNAAGAIAPSTPGGTVPVFGIVQGSGDAIRTFAGGPGGTAAVSIPGAVAQPNTPDQLADFSSRGPGLFGATLKPDVTAPGVSILAAIAGTSLAPGSENVIGLMNGTSMASPHHAGAAVLVKQARPTWTSAEIKSAMMMTATRDVLMENGIDAAGPFARGAGRLRVDQAIRAGLVLNETKANYIAANPATGGDPSELNLPTLMNDWCHQKCTFTRTFRSTQRVSQTWSVKFEGLKASATPSTFTVRPGQSVTVKFTVETAAITPDGRFHFGDALLQPQSTAFQLPALRLPMAIAVQPPAVSLPAQAEGSARVGQQTTVVVPVRNVGGARLQYATDSSGTASVEIANTLPTVAGSGYRSTRYTDTANPPGQYAADDFELGSSVQLTSLVAHGFMLTTVPLATATQDITWSIYADVGGVPGGNPQTAMGAAVWSYTALPTAAGVGTTNATISLDLNAAGRELTLPPGRYWLVVNARSTFANRWVWYAADSSAPSSRPGFAAITPSVGAWAADTAFPGLAWSVAGQVGCGASWIGTVVPASGSLMPGASENVSITLNASRLAAGRHEGNACMTTNDPQRRKVAVRVVFNVMP